jgi:hypothetical protein
MISPFLAHSHTEVQCIGPYASIAAVQSAIPGPDFAPKPACTLSGKAAPPPSCQRPGAAPRGYRDCVALMWDRKHPAEVKRRQEEAHFGLLVRTNIRAAKGNNTLAVAFIGCECWPWQNAVLWLSCGQNFSPACPLLLGFFSIRAAVLTTGLFAPITPGFWFSPVTKPQLQRMSLLLVATKSPSRPAIRGHSARRAPPARRVRRWSPPPRPRLRRDPSGSQCRSAWSARRRCRWPVTDRTRIRSVTVPEADTRAVAGARRTPHGGRAASAARQAYRGAPEGEARP